MANKKSPASGWPIVQGDFHTGDPNSPVAVVTMGSHLDEAAICSAGAAIAGSCKTENLGLEKVIANVISNPNIRFVITCGTEVKGHLSGQSLIALHQNGVDGGKIVGSKGAIPFIENLSGDHIKRFQEQVEFVDIMESEDVGAISAKIKELIARDPGAFEADAMIVEIKDESGGAAEESGEVRPMSAEVALIHARMKTVQRMITDIGFYDKYAAGVYGGKVEGLMIGLIVSFVIVGLLLMGHGVS
ncbi:MAG TPA: tetrahydromethanopterin S-methyltransferase subunit A [Methanospirillum sp.]|jgi:tetrahydromethanopterin S-methyltransferase subunit A|uniref:tetrahydromethanopterin S-methyltransferase subunit A n=1 Tax=Methanospirillum sp. TaxID=45200 RepID=UPI0009D16CAB|nr:tetrahydromethanopterin S-methyltransferase subunit A [Methanospirillum sp.]OQB37450.1 MAG: Tetrahydromethanopterin S-methyltransferase subunit A 1 [Euryarchaeota archaeon ADurb.Bin165]HPY60089.1 tetrahydromethanopterin S-methyltransferase subunit A [Methanospirillum sp.]